MNINALKVQIKIGEKRLTYSEFSKISGISKQTLSHILDRKNCSPKHAGMIANALNIPLDEIVTE